MYLYAQQDKRIARMNDVAMDDEPDDFILLKEFAKKHPVIMEDVLKGFVCHPDNKAIGNNLFGFLNEVENGRIKLD